MAKGIQSDGTNCRTDNCKRHGNAPLKAVLGDIMETHVRVLEDASLAVITKHSDIDSDVAKSITQEFLAPLKEGKTITPEALAEALYTKGGMSEGEAIGRTYTAFSGLMDNSVINPGDQIIINATGERGTAAEFSTSFGEKTRFKSENTSSNNDFKFFGADEVSKLHPEVDHTYVREQVLATPQHEYIPASNIRVMMEQESNSLDPNARAAKEFGKDGQFAGEHIRQIGRDMQNSYGIQGGGVTRRQVVNFLKNELVKEIPNNDNIDGSDHYERVEATKNGLRSILGYIDPQNANRLTDSTYLNRR